MIFIDLEESFENLLQILYHYLAVFLWQKKNR